jgi:4-diphosphocytidyl-2-C-methyl-D-erythritol kinase
MIYHASKNRFSIASPAKLNLFLEIHARRSDGFHELETIMMPFSLFDFLTFRPTDDDRLELAVHASRQLTGHQIPTDGRNLVIQALSIVRQLSGKTGGVLATLYKRIPVQAGLGGASGNAAATLLAANRFWNLNWPPARLLEIAQRIGSDVGFFLGDGLARCTGTGSDVQNLNYRCCLYVVAVKPPFGLSTRDIYARCDVPDKPITSHAVLAGLKSGRFAQIGRALFNRLQKPAADTHDGIARLGSEFGKTNCVGHQLTGSGSCYFGIYRNRKAMNQAARILANRLPESEIFAGQSLSSRND